MCCLKPYNISYIYFRIVHGQQQQKKATLQPVIRCIIPLMEHNFYYLVDKLSISSCMVVHYKNTDVQ